MFNSDFWNEVLIGGIGIVLTGFLTLFALAIIRYMWLLIKHWNDEWY